MPAIENIYTGSHTYSSGEVAVTEPIGATVVMENCLLTFTQEGGHTAASQSDHSLVRGQITSTTEMTFTRAANHSTVLPTVYWTITEFAAGALNSDVQRGDLDLIGSEMTVTIDPVTLAQSSVMLSRTTNVAGLTAPGQVRCELTSPTTIKFSSTYSTPSSGTHYCEWQLIEFKENEAVVNRGDWDLAPSDAGDNIPVVFNANTTLLNISGESSEGYYSQSIAYGLIDGDDNLNVERGLTAGGGAGLIGISYELITFFDGTTVKRGVQLLEDTTTDYSVDPGVVDASVASVWGQGHAGQTKGTITSQAHGEFLVGAVLTDKDTLDIQRFTGVSGRDVSLAWQIVEWGSDVIAAPEAQTIFRYPRHRVYAPKGLDFAPNGSGAGLRLSRVHDDSFEYTLSTWFRRSATPSSEETILSLGSDSSGTPLLRIHMVSSGVGVSFQVRSINGNAINNVHTPDVIDNRWHHISGTVYHGENGAASSFSRILVDGKISAAVTGSYLDPTTFDNVTLGYLDRTSSALEYNGEIALPAVWNRTMSLQEQHKLYQHGGHPLCLPHKLQHFVDFTQGFADSSDGAFKDLGKGGGRFFDKTSTMTPANLTAVGGVTARHPAGPRFIYKDAILAPVPETPLRIINSGHALANNVVAAYVFDQNSGITIPDIHSDGNDAVLCRYLPVSEANTIYSTTYVGGQGFATDGTYGYISGYAGTNIGRLSGDTWATLDYSNNPNNDSVATAVGTTDRVGDLCYYFDDSSVLVAMYLNAGGVGMIGICEDPGIDMNLDRVIDTTAEIDKPSGVFCENNSVYVTSFSTGDGTGVFEYNYTTGAYIGVTNFAFDLVNVQGVSKDSDGNWYFSFFINTSDSQSYIFRFDADRKVTGSWWMKGGTNYEIEGIDATQDGFLYLNFKDLSLKNMRFNISDMDTVPGTSTVPWGADKIQLDESDADKWKIMIPRTFGTEGSIHTVCHPTTLFNYNNWLASWSLSNNHWEGWCYSDGRRAFRSNNSTASILAGSAIETALTATWSATNTREYIYQDKTQGTSRTPGAAHVGPIILGGVEVYGARSDFAFNNAFVFDRELTSAEVDDLIDNPESLWALSPVASSGLINIGAGLFMSPLLHRRLLIASYK